MLIRSLLLVLGALGCAWSTMAESIPVKVEIRGEKGNYQLYRDGRPYKIRGAGTQVIADFSSLQRHGGNSIRTWDTNNEELLDRAHELGISVSLCLDVMRERHGFDYDDEAAVRRQFEYLKGEVLKYRNHPALLTWIIGNELNHDFSNPRVYDAVNEISKMIHELDPNHPTTTTTAGISASLADVISERAPDLDFVSVQVYGGLFDLKDALESIDLDKPIMVTEWGTIGHWEVPETAWGAPIELNSHDKAQTYRKGYQEVLLPLAGRLIGDYVFLWGHKQERTPTWYGVFTPDGGRTEAVDVMEHIWTGKHPENRAPRLDSMKIDGKVVTQDIRLQSGRSYSAMVDVVDSEQEILEFDWQLMKESDAKQSGGDKEEVPLNLSLLIQEVSGAKATFRTPSEPGAYRLFVYVNDDHGGAAHANIPFYVVGDARSLGDK